MFSSGFFLLPGIASASTGSGVVLAYLVAGILILPAMFSVAELATAMPRAGGAYYFLDRAMGPLMGTIGGVGSWISLVLKSAFALLGLGAYLVLFFDVPIKPLAVALTVVFAVVNIMGAKEGAELQRWLVYILVGILAWFVAQGLWAAAGSPAATERLEPGALFAGGLEAIAATVGMVFVSYAGLTKVASVAEEIDHPERNIPLGMILSLATATSIYVIGVYVLVVLLEPAALATDLTPVATAGESVMGWLPAGLGLVAIVIAAIAAFASTGNAGILSSSRYPMAMARDHLVPARFARVGRSGTNPRHHRDIGRHDRGHRRLRRERCGQVGKRVPAPALRTLVPRGDRHAREPDRRVRPWFPIPSLSVDAARWDRCQHLPRGRDGGAGHRLHVWHGCPLRRLVLLLGPQERDPSGCCVPLLRAARSTHPPTARRRARRDPGRTSHRATTPTQSAWRTQ